MKVGQFWVAEKVFNDSTFEFFGFSGLFRKDCRISLFIYRYISVLLQLGQLRIIRNIDQLLVIFSWILLQRKCVQVVHVETARSRTCCQLISPKDCKFAKGEVANNLGQICSKFFALGAWEEWKQQTADARELLHAENILTCSACSCMPRERDALHSWCQGVEHAGNILYNRLSSMQSVGTTLNSWCQEVLHAGNTFCYWRSCMQSVGNALHSWCQEVLHAGNICILLAQRQSVVDTLRYICIVHPWSESYYVQVTPRTMYVHIVDTLQYIQYTANVREPSHWH
jgi:hypothetical protein